MNRSRPISEIDVSCYKFSDAVSTIISSSSNDFLLFTNFKLDSGDQILLVKHLEIGIGLKTYH
jgi:hypothetical protein